MTILNIIEERGSIRKYKAKPIPKRDLEQILEAARLAQSAANRQPWQFLVVTNKEIKTKLTEAAHWPNRPPQSFIGTAAAIIICLAEPKTSRPVGPFDGFLIDLSIAIENMALTAWDIGIGSCWIGAFQEEKVKELLSIPNHLRVISLLTLGYPDENPKPKVRKSLTEIIHYNKYGNKHL